MGVRLGQQNGKVQISSGTSAETISFVDKHLGWATWNHIRLDCNVLEIIPAEVRFQRMALPRSFLTDFQQSS